MNGCVINVPTGSYTLTTAISLTTDNVKIIGNGSKIIGARAITTMVSMSGNSVEVSGLIFALNNSLYGILAHQGVGQKVTGNSFTGVGGIYIYLNTNPGPSIIANNIFDGTTGCAGSSDIDVYQ